MALDQEGGGESVTSRDPSKIKRCTVNHSSRFSSISVSMLKQQKNNQKKKKCCE
jgi:hypothetical protein